MKFILRRKKIYEEVLIKFSSLRFVIIINLGDKGFCLRNVLNEMTNDKKLGTWES